MKVKKRLGLRNQFCLFVQVILRPSNNYIFQVNEYLPGIKEYAVIVGDEIYHRAGAGIAWAREHGLGCIELAAESAFKAAFAGAELIKDGVIAVVQCFKDMLT